MEGQREREERRIEGGGGRRVCVFVTAVPITKLFARKATGEEGDHARSLGMMKKLGRDEQKLGQGAKYVC